MKNRTRIWQALTELDLDPFSRIQTGGFHHSKLSIYCEASRQMLPNACLQGWLIETFT